MSHRSYSGSLKKKSIGVRALGISAGAVTVVVDASQGDLFTLSTASSGTGSTPTFNVLNPYDGQEIWIRVDSNDACDGTSIAIQLDGSAVVDSPIIITANAENLIKVRVMENGGAATLFASKDSTFSDISVSGDATITGDVAISGALRLAATTELTIATGVVTVTKSFHSIDTECDACTDCLVTINGGAAGDILIIVANNGARSIVAKDGTGNLELAGDFTLDNVEDTLSLIYNGTNWLETSRSGNGA